MYIRVRIYTAVLLFLSVATTLWAENVDDALKGFDDVSVLQSGNIQKHTKEKEAVFKEVTGKLTEQIIYSYNGVAPHDNITSLKSSFFLDFEHKFENNWKFKINAKAYYDAIYDLRDGPYTDQEKDEMRSEVELFDAYIEGSITNSLDMKLGRQVVVWGRSDTIRITDVLNPIDNRQPGMVDIEDLRLPVAMAKFDYYIGKWRITPIAILEQRFTKDPPFGSPFNPAAFPLPHEDDYSGITYALSIGAEYSGWDVNFYAAHIYDDTKFIQDPLGLNTVIKHNKVNMFGTAWNFLSGSWLFKTELAYFDKLRYTMAPDKELSRTDTLVGIEYNGIADTRISYDISLRHFNQYDSRLELEYILTPGGERVELIPVQKDTWQHALRVSSDFKKP
jgi:hypothetical protein